jgi:hypothetical protein
VSSQTSALKSWPTTSIRRPHIDGTDGLLGDGLTSRMLKDQRSLMMWRARERGGNCSVADAADIGHSLTIKLVFSGTSGSNFLVVLLLATLQAYVPIVPAPALFEARPA